ncbi:MAG: cell division protein FtsZ, partial [Sphingosinicella sp.]|uniref:cell division protein FtsZ n=1 Tax=Sphingosinicella sp. TaxID=1917971 RepID=UPI004037F61A
RARSAEAGIDELQQHVDTLIVIPNQNLFRIANPNTTFKEAFMMADEVLQQGVRGITDLMVRPGLINLDFADVRSVMSEMGKAMMGTGEAGGDNRAIEAAEKAIANPLLDGVSMKGAKGVIISITGGEDMRLMEVDEAANHIKELVDPDANIIWGSAFNNDLDGKLRVSVVATGIDVEEATQAPPLQAKVFAFPGARQQSEAAAEPAPEPVAEAQAPAYEPAPVAIPEPITLTPPEGFEEAAEAAAELTLDQPTEEEADELLLDSVDLVDDDIPPTATEDEEAQAGGRRTWLAREEEEAPPPEPAAKPAGGTLFERMSNIARGAAKAQVDEKEETGPRLRGGRDPLDIPRFLNRQNNQ